MHPSNKIGSYAQPHKGLLEYLADQVMAQLTEQALEPETGRNPCSEPESGEQSTKATSFYFNSGGSVCNCTPCVVMRRLV
ncbi:hypothetical protein PVE_R2G0301 [Pseudomonas veronii 1YdBTEX2]|uniref:Uncharacterized protein n=1 Tax=Pseudomonas veronii 1YdBTEX2 TaxID=1295141 RepID=A0A1D3K7P5_PSEVE|nr:hypothetical protein PVE_R2G0301 [Pseudomonas veronii 1YdBTEX2]